MRAGDRLPIVHLPHSGERLSSWVERMATFYAMTVPEFLCELGLPGECVFQLERNLPVEMAILIGARTGLDQSRLQAMCFQGVVPDAFPLIARKNRHVCRLCSSGIQLKAASLPWIFRCPVHDVDYQTVSGAPLAEVFGENEFADLDKLAKKGATILDAWANGGLSVGWTPFEMLAFLTTRHRRSSPPSLSEQPRLSLQARRDYHDFLNTPIARQALLVVVPEYDRVAPVLAKPVQSGLHGLTRGSLLQAFAMTVGIGRLSERPVDCVISAFLASDVEGERRLREVIKQWPVSLRRSISARLWRAQRDERARLENEKGRKRRQSHKFRPAQSHQYRY